MNNTFYAFMNRMKLISRWGLMRNQRTEDVAQHSHMTAVIAHALGIIDNEIFKRPTDANLAAVLALYHETAEVLTGDMPTPVKYYNAAMTEAFKAAEKSAEEKLVNLLPEPLKPAMKAAVCPVQSRESQLVKFADKIAAFVKCTEETSAGNREFAAAKAAQEAVLKSYNDPAVNYFLTEFGQTFSMSLDELIRG